MSIVAQQARFQLFSPLPSEKYEALKEDIRKNGVLVPVEVDQHGQILDGHHRIQAWQELRAEGVNLADYTRIIRHFENDDDREEHAAKMNSNRRDVTLEDKQRNALRWRQHGWSYRRIADALAVSHMTVSRWIPEQDSTVTDVTVDLPERVIGKDGKSRPATMPRPKPTVLATNAKEQERALLAMEGFDEPEDDDAEGEFVNTSTGELLTASQLRQKTMQRERERRNARLANGSDTSTLQGTYRVLYADPPWQYGHDLTEGYGAAVHHYPTMPLEELQALPVRDIARDDAVLFLWATSPLLPDALSIITAWGFTYKTSFVWDKVKHNFGHYNSVRHEFLLVATRGSCTPDVKKLFDSVQVIERTEKHSEKPEEFRAIIDTLYPPAAECDRIELFRRGNAPEGWSVWGNESGIA